jgi:tRNA-Thr(GGU) m(6)t(6)A37 methyltransferase TsaA
VSNQRYEVQPIGWVESQLIDRSAAPKQGDEGAPVARIVFEPAYREAAHDLRPGDEVLVLTWLHLSDRSTLSVHPRGDRSRPITGVFSTRSPDRPNPIGLHAVTIESVADGAISVHNLEAVNGTPVLDIKPILADRRER